MSPQIAFSPKVLAFAVFSIAAGIIVPPTFPRWTIFIAITASCVYLFNTTTGNVIYDFPLAVWYMCIIFTASHYLLLSNPQRDFRRVGQAESIENASFIERTRWGFRLWSSVRGIGWKHEPERIFLAASRPGTTRGSFLVRRVLSMLVYALLADVATLYNKECPTFQKEGVSFGERPWMRKPMDMFFWVLGCTSVASMLHTSVSIASVVLGLSRPEDWKPPFGNWLDAYNLQRFWGRVWQQFMRQFFSAHGKFLAYRVFRLHPGSNGSAYVQLFTAFLLSGLMHWPGDYTLSLDWTRSGSMVFFPLQIIAIIGEVNVIGLASNFGIKRGPPTIPIRILGYAWVIGWFAVTLPIWWDPIHRGGFMDMINFKNSAVTWAWQHLRVAWR